MNDEIVGGSATVKLVALVAVPPVVVTLSLPVVAPVGTFVLITVELSTVNVAALPLKATEFTVTPVPLKFVPLI